MLRIFNLLYPKKEKLISQKVYFCEYQDLVYLIVQDRDTGKIIKSAKSSDGFLFQKVRVKEEIVKQYPQYRDKRRSFIQKLYANQLAPASEFIDHSKISMQNAFKTPEGVLLFYHYHNYQAYQVGAAGFSASDDPQLIWRHQQPVWEMYDQVAGKKIKFIDLLEIRGQYIAYWLVEDEAVWATVYPAYRITKEIEIIERSQLKRPQANPLINPNPTHHWESFNTFNPAALYEADKVHLLYRAQGHDYVSSIGYASSTDGLNIEQKLEQPIFVPTQAFEASVKPGQLNMAFASAGCGGCEDPRLTRIDDRIYMTYVAFNGYSEPRIALTSISIKDFLSHNWLWTHPVLISKPGLVTKSACILPEKINGKYVVFHRVFPDILIDFRDDLDFSDGQYLSAQKKISPRSALWWDSRKIGVGAPPLKTKDGWLLIYQSIDDKEGHPYKVGAMLLDLEDPSVVLHRSSQPILQPQEWYENDGFKAGVVYPCGAVIIDQTLFVYYGGADSRVCVATADLEQFLAELKKEGKAKVETTIITKLDQESLAKRGLFKK
jgi:predicted GH43/DUF377 family glycosyl hydrolase